MIVNLLTEFDQYLYLLTGWTDKILHFDDSDEFDSFEIKMSKF